MFCIAKIDSMFLAIAWLYLDYFRIARHPGRAGVEVVVSEGPDLVVVVLVNERTPKNQKILGPIQNQRCFRSECQPVRRVKGEE